MCNISARSTRVSRPTNTRFFQKPCTYGTAAHNHWPATITDQPANVGELQELPIQGWSRDADPVNKRLFWICTTAQAPIGLAKKATAQDIYFGLRTFYTFLYSTTHTKHTHHHYPAYLIGRSAPWRGRTSRHRSYRMFRTLGNTFCPHLKWRYLQVCFTRSWE